MHISKRFCCSDRGSRRSSTAPPARPLQPPVAGQLRHTAGQLDVVALVPAACARWRHACGAAGGATGTGAAAAAQRSARRATHPAPAPWPRRRPPPPTSSAAPSGCSAADHDGRRASPAAVGAGRGGADGFEHPSSPPEGPQRALPNPVTHPAIGGVIDRHCCSPSAQIERSRRSKQQTAFSWAAGALWGLD